jgi:hypothetical protein
LIYNLKNYLYFIFESFWKQNDDDDDEDDDDDDMEEIDEGVEIESLYLLLTNKLLFIFGLIACFSIIILLLILVFFKLNVF